MSSKDPNVVAGWTKPTPEARKFHWFDADEMRSLCGRYILFRRDAKRMEPDTGPSIDDCAPCRRRLDARVKP